MNVKLFLFIVFILNLLLINFCFGGELMTKVIHKDFDAVKKLLAEGADINAKAKDGSTALSLAKKEKDEKMTTLLYELGAIN